MNKYINFFLIFLIVISGSGFYAYKQNRTSEDGKNYDNFAKCLAEKKVTMYGAYWCSHCKANKKMFGDSFQYVPYVECTEDVKTCTEKNIEAYPTWIFGDGQKVTGVQSLQEISEKSGCLIE